MTARRPLKVVHIGSGRYWPGDRSHVTYAIWKELARGFKAYRVIARSEGRPAEWTDGNLRITLIPSVARREVEFLLSQFLIIPLILRERPDVIVCQSPVTGGLAAILVALMTRARILLEIHGAEFFVPTRVGSSIWLLQRLTQFALKHADLIRVLSPRMERTLLDRYGQKLASRVRVLPPRVNVTLFAPRSRAQAPGGPLRLAMVGAVNNNKGQLRLIRALKDTLIPIELHIVGDGPDLAQCREIGANLSDAGSGLRVICHGHIEPAGVADVLRGCDVFVMYSQSEGMPRAMMEAMAAGLPVVTTDVGFTADIIGNGTQGIVLGSDPDSEIWNAIEQFRADPTLASRMGSAAAGRVRREYDSVRIFENYRRLIAETAASCL